jgi:DNA-binding ferritin-like protein (Dps family)
VKKLNELAKTVKKALDAAKKAEDAADKVQDRTVTFWGGRKEAIEELQTASVSIADSVASNAEAQKVSFEFQTKLAEITKYLFGLGVSNIASNRIVVRELELRLNGASKEELSELARQEMLMVIKQLKDQEDILIKQEELAKNVKGHENRLKSQSEKYKILEDELQDLKEAVRKNESKMATIAKDKKHQIQQLKNLIARYDLLDEQINYIKIDEKYYKKNMEIFLKKCDKYDETLSTIAKDIDIYKVSILRKMFFTFAIGVFGTLLGSLALIILLLK